MLPPRRPDEASSTRRARSRDPHAHRRCRRRRSARRERRGSGRHDADPVHPRTCWGCRSERQSRPRRSGADAQRSATTRALRHHAGSQDRRTSSSPPYCRLRSPIAPGRSSSALRRGPGASDDRRDTPPRSGDPTRTRRRRDRRRGDASSRSPSSPGWTSWPAPPASWQSWMASRRPPAAPHADPSGEAPSAHRRRSGTGEERRRYHGPSAPIGGGLRARPGGRAQRCLGNFEQAVPAARTARAGCSAQPASRHRTRRAHRSHALTPDRSDVDVSRMTRSPSAGSRT